MECPVCQQQSRKYGKDRKGNQRYYCARCFLTFSEPSAPRPFGTQYLTMDKATLALRLLLEGNSIRSSCRLAKIGQKTLLRLLLQIGEGCERLMEETIKDVVCDSVQCDEVWSYVYCKEKTRVRKGHHFDETGDCYTWTAIEPRTKLLLAYAVGKRDNYTGYRFVSKLRRAIWGRCQFNTDGLGIYRSVLPMVFHHPDHAQIIKLFNQPVDGEARYSPPTIVAINIEAASGHPDLKAASTSHVERSNLTVRMMNRRFTRLTNGFSKSWRHHSAALGLLFAYYNFCRKHMTIKETPAQAACLTDHAWTVAELIQKAYPLGAQLVA